MPLCFGLAHRGMLPKNRDPVPRQAAVRHARGLVGLGLATQLSSLALSSPANARSPCTGYLPAAVPRCCSFTTAAASTSLLVLAWPCRTIRGGRT